MSVRVKGIKRYRSKGRWYCYHRPSGTRILSPAGTPEFLAEIAALATKPSPRPKSGTLGSLFGEYRGSAKFQELAVRTQADYHRVMNWLAPLHDMPLKEIDPPFARQLRDKAHQTKRFRFANYVISVLSAALSWAVEYGIVEQNPIRNQVKKVRRPKQLARRNRPWTLAERDMVLAEAPEHLKIPVALMRYVGFRTGDALCAPKSAYDGKSLQIRTAKTGQLVWLPCPAPLRAILDGAVRHEATTISVNSAGRPWTGNGFRASLAKFLKKLEAAGKIGAGLSPHGLRHSVAVDLRELGFDERAIADFLGQSEIETARGYAQGADLRKKMVAMVDTLDRQRGN